VTQPLPSGRDIFKRYNLDANIHWIEVVDFNHIENANGLPHGILDAIAWVESRYDPLARSPAGARGAFQFMPATARHYHVDPLDPIASAKAAGFYLGELLKKYNGNVDKAIAAYNCGPGRINKDFPDSLPRQTKAYLAQVKARMAE